jgi:hypothetical protein
MDALSRLEPVARPLLQQVDEVLLRAGAPGDHEIWPLLRRVGVTPGDAVTAVATLAGMGGGTDFGAALPALADELLRQADGYAAAVVPTRVPWSGGAGQAYAARATALARHLNGSTDHAGTGNLRAGSIVGQGLYESDYGAGREGYSPGRAADNLAGRLRETASYVDDVGDWQRRSRDRIARALATVLSSAQAVSLRASHASPAETAASAGSAVTGGTAAAAGGALTAGSAVTAGPSVTAPTAVVVAAADIGAYVLTAAADALTDGDSVYRSWAGRLAELPYRDADDRGPGRFDETIHIGR